MSKVKTLRSNPRVVNGHRRRALVARWRAQVKAGYCCHICGHEIDLTRQYPDPWSFVVDEVIPVARGGDPLSWHNTRPAHRWCNGIKRDKSIEWARREVARQLAGVRKREDDAKLHVSHAPFSRLDV